MMEAFSCRSEGRCERHWRQQLMQRNMPFLLHVFASFR
jgi:hypothetical protein